MNIGQRAARAAAILGLLAVGACQSAGGLGSILGSVLGQGQGQTQQISGTIRGVDTQSQYISLQQSNGQNVSVSYDNNTQVSYQNQNYPVTALQNGDQVTLRLQNNSNGAYYTDLVQVDQSVSNNNGGVYNGGGGNNNVQSLQGNVRQIDRNNGAFTVDVGNGQLVTVTMPYNASRADSDRFQNLRNGDFVRFYATFLGNSSVQLRQFY